MADEKLTQLPELTTPANEDLFYLVDDPAGSPISKKITYANLKAAIGAGGGEANVGANVGAGDGVYANKTGVTLNFKSLVAGSGITLTPSATELQIDALVSADTHFGSPTNSLVVDYTGQISGAYADIGTAMAAVTVEQVIYVFGSNFDFSTITWKSGVTLVLMPWSAPFVANTITVPNNVVANIVSLGGYLNLNASPCIQFGATNSGIQIIGTANNAVHDACIQSSGGGIVLDASAGVLSIMHIVDAGIYGAPAADAISLVGSTDLLIRGSVISSGTNAITSTAPITDAQIFHTDFFGGINNVSVEAGNYSNTKDGVTWPSVSAIDTNIASAANVLVVDPSGGIQNSYTTVGAAIAARVTESVILVFGNTTETGPITLPLFMTLRGAYRGLEVNMGSNTFTMSLGSSLENISVSGNLVNPLVNGTGNLRNATVLNSGAGSAVASSGGGITARRSILSCPTGIGADLTVAALTAYDSQVSGNIAVRCGSGTHVKSYGSSIEGTVNGISLLSGAVLGSVEISHSLVSAVSDVAITSADAWVNAEIWHTELQAPTTPVSNVSLKADNYSNTFNGVTWPAVAGIDTNIASAGNLLVVDPSGGIRNSYATVEAADAVAVDGDTILILGDIEITSIIPASAKSITIWIAPGVTVSTDDGISRFLAYGSETLKIVNQGAINTPYYASRSIVYSVQGGNNSRLEIYGGNVTNNFPNGIPIGVGNTVELFLYNVAAISRDANGAGYAIGAVSGPGTAVLAANHGIFNCHLEIQGVTGSQETVDLSATAINIHGSALYGGSAPFGTSAPAQGNHSNTFEGETWRQGVYVSQVDITAASGATKTIDLNVTDVWRVTLSADCTFTFSNPPTAGKAGSFTIELIQDGTGSWTPTWPAAVIWPSGTAPTLNTAAGTKHLVSFMTTDGGTTWYGTAITDFS